MKTGIAHLKGVIVFILWVLSSIIFGSASVIFGLIRHLIPGQALRNAFARYVHKLGDLWGQTNALTWRWVTRPNIQVTGDKHFNLKHSFMLLSNHQSWIDIPILYSVLSGRLPMLRFFMKIELIRIPIIGWACWALDFPLMRRYKKSDIQKNPKLKGKDLETTKKACERLKPFSVTMINFPEGTRFTQEKHDTLKSPYRHLLRPKAGGTALTLQYFGDQINDIVDVTLAYPNGKIGFWDLLSGQTHEIKIHITLIPIVDELRGDYGKDSSYRKAFHHWLTELWHKKDEKLSELLGK